MYYVGFMQNDITETITGVNMGLRRRAYVRTCVRTYTPTLTLLKGKINEFTGATPHAEVDKALAL
jgi:hypothetical protein